METNVLKILKKMAEKIVDIAKNSPDQKFADDLWPIAALLSNIVERLENTPKTLRGE